MIINDTVKITSEVSWIQPPISEQDLIIGNSKLIDGIYVQVSSSIGSIPFGSLIDSEMQTIEAAAIADYWNLEESDDSDA